MTKDKVKEILRRETKGLRINEKTRHNLIFSYDDVEGMLRELEEDYNTYLKSVLDRLMGIHKKVSKLI